MDDDIVWTINDYWDGCTMGIADFENNHCIYERIFDEKKDEWSNNYYLTPISQADFLVVVQDWERWKKWRLDFDNGIKSTSSWEKGIDLEAIARNSSDYRKTIRYGKFMGDWRCCESMTVKWNKSTV